MQSLQVSGTTLAHKGATSRSSRRSGWAVGLMVLASVAVVYVLTCQNDVCANSNPYVVDSGEYQVALGSWGTVHYTGAPLYSLLGAAFVAVLRTLGVPPAAASSLFSVACALVTLGLVYALALRWTYNPWAAGAATLVLAFGRSFWINSVVTEIYSFGLALSLGALWLALRYVETRRAQDLYALAFVWGLAVVHHRLATFLAPALALLVLPVLLREGRRIPRLLASALGCGVLAFAFYLYLPLRARMGAWTYGDVGTWSGFWYNFWAREVGFLLMPPANLAGWVGNVRAVWGKLLVEWHGAGLASVALGLLVSITWRKTRPRGVALAAWVAAYVAFEVAFQQAVLAEAALLWVSVVLAVALALGTAWLWQVRRWLGVLAVAATLLLASVALRGEWRGVLAITRHARGREVIELLKVSMPTSEGPVQPTFMTTWGGDYFAAAYGLRVTHELRGFRAVDHRADPVQILGSGSRLVTLPSTFYILPMAWWRERLGSLYLSSAAPGLVEIGQHALYNEAQVATDNPLELDDDLRLLTYQVRRIQDTLHITLYWQAARVPSQDYSVMVHLSDKPAVATPEDVVAQADSQAPVYGWYPTTQWSAGEIVREDYELHVPAGKTPRLLVVGMYTRDAAGAFHNLGVVNLELSGL